MVINVLQQATAGPIEVLHAQTAIVHVQILLTMATVFIGKPAVNIIKI